MSELQQLRVLQEDMGSDVVTLENFEEGVTYLFISPFQSFDSAIRSVAKTCPHLSLLEVQELVRTNCPDIKEMNERLGVDLPPVPRFEAAPEAVPPPVAEKGAHRRMRPPRWARIAAVAAPALVGGTLIAQLFTPAGRSDHAQGSQALSVSQADTPSVFDDPTFKQYVKGGAIHCASVGQYAAKCVDTDGQVMLSEASVGDSAVFTFSYDHEKIGFRIFDSESAAQVWAQEDANKELYEHLTIKGRVALWGTDEARLRDWARSLEEQPTKNTSTMGGASPLAASASSSFSALPKRLAVLAFGTLGVTDRQVMALAAPATIQQAQTMRAVALVMGTADPQGNIGPGTGMGDAAAIAADAPHPPSGVSWTVNGSESSTPLPSDPPVASVPTSTTTPQPDSSSPAPAEDTTQPSAQPTTSESTAEPAPAEDTTTTQQPTADTSTPAQDEQPAAESQPEDAAPAPAESTTTEAEPEDTTPAESTPAETEPADTTPAPAESATEPASPAPAEPTAPGEGAQGQETTPAPPVQEEPEDALSVETMPTAWAA